MPIIQLTEPSGALADALRLGVLIHEPPKGAWGAEGNVVRYRELVVFGQERRVDA